MHALSEINFFFNDSFSHNIWTLFGMCFSQSFIEVNFFFIVFWTNPDTRSMKNERST